MREMAAAGTEAINRSRRIARRIALIWLIEARAEHQASNDLDRSVVARGASLRLHAIQVLLVICGDFAR
jgi:hypothetical protein